MAHDWFISAITHEGSVDACLALVQGELLRRQEFIQSIRSCLAGEQRRDDAVTELSQKIRTIENTLKFRLSMLTADRPQPWFRTPAVNMSGPFQASVLNEPVFTAYDPSRVDEVQSLIQSAWVNPKIDLSLLPEGPCLWRTLLSYRSRYEAISILKAFGTEYRLDELPDGLPIDLDCRSLRAFLLNVKNELCAAKLRLDQCFKDLLNKSEELFNVQRQSERDRPKSHYKKSAEKIRDEMSRRRGEVHRYLTPSDLQALSFMGFSELPLPETLKKRYISMAKSLHPDRETGDESRFKALVSAYNHLSQRLTGGKSF